MFGNLKNADLPSLRFLQETGIFGKNRIIFGVYDTLQKYEACSKTPFHYVDEHTVASGSIPWELFHVQIFKSLFTLSFIELTCL